MTRLQMSIRRTAVAVVCLGAVAAFAPGARADEPVSGVDPEEAAALAKEVGLSEQQQRAIRKIHDDTRKQEVKLHAEIEVHSIDLRRALEQDDPKEKEVAVLIEKIARLEGEVRKTRILASLAVRKLLSADQRKKMQALRGSRRHRYLVLEREAMDLARAEVGAEADRIRDQVREIEAQARELEKKARTGDKARQRALERAAREIEERARELERHQRELERHHRDLERVKERELERVRERERDKVRDVRKGDKAELRIQSRQPAKVYLDGKRIGTTPVVTEVAAGDHEIELRWKKSSNKRRITVKAASQVQLNIDPPK